MTKKKTRQTALEWLSQNWLLVASAVLLAFIPLYPKLPLWQIIPGYRVRVRLEDVLVGLTLLGWVLHSIKTKKIPQHPLLKGIGVFALIGLASTLSGVFVTQTIGPDQRLVLKSFLYLARYLEYFALSLIVFASVSTQKHFSTLKRVAVVTTSLVALYGLGQKFLEWPLISTMLREFSTGEILYLTPGARIQSTFAGHYDLAAYVVIMSPLVLSWFFTTRKRVTKLALSGAYLLLTWLIVESGSRISFAAFGISSVLAAAMSSLSFGTSKKITPKKVITVVKNTSLLVLIITAMTYQFGDELQGRFLQLIRGSDTIYPYYQQITGDNPPKDNSLDASDSRPVPNKPSDVIVDVPDYVAVATTSSTGEETTIIIQQDRVFSECSQKRSLSLCIRLETLWPQAWEAFMTYPLLGKGFGTLNQEFSGQFTEAESTDNNLLRTLGETGILGFISFYGLVVYTIWLGVKAWIKTKESSVRIAAITVVAASVGLLANALYIDVFVASKVAFTYWGLVGLCLGHILNKENHAA